jgi:DNA-binding HxlR family transcriptional regulator
MRLYRCAYATVPPKVEYSLPEYGRLPKQALQAICEWGRVHMHRIGTETSLDRLPNGSEAPKQS